MARRVAYRKCEVEGCHRTTTDYHFGLFCSECQDEDKRTLLEEDYFELLRATSELCSAVESLSHSPLATERVRAVLKRLGG